jgi:putative nucleotide binding protein
MRKKDDYAIVLDFLPYGDPMEGKMQPIVQAIGEQHLALLELAPIRGIQFAPHERIYIGPEKRDKISFIVGRLPQEKLTVQAKQRLAEVISKVVETRQSEFVAFFNNARAMNTRLHQLELLPGFGKKHMKEVLTARDEKPFESFDDIKQRAHNIPDPRKAVEKRLLEEITEHQRHLLFVI